MGRRAAALVRSVLVVTVLVVTVLVVTVLVVTPSCASDNKPAAAARPVYVAVGASETVGVGADDPAAQAWPAVFSGAVGVSRYVNVGISGATVQQALDQELPKALAATADLATVWLNVNDIVKFVSAEQYEGRLRTLVKALRRGGRARVLVANTPPLEVLPAARPYAALAAGAVASYNAAIARVVQEEGAELVDLHAAGLAAQRDGRAPALVAQDGFHPSTAGHAAVAAEFLRVYRAATAR